MDAKPEPTASGEVYLNFGNVQATVNHIKEAIMWLEATQGSNSPFTQCGERADGLLYLRTAGGNQYE